MKNALVIALVLMGLALFTSMAIAEDAAVDEGTGLEPASAELVMSATPSEIVFENHGTAPINIGQLEVNIEGTNTVVTRLPNTQILEPNPFTFTDELNKQFTAYRFVVVPEQTLPVGTKLVLTNGLGFYARCVVQ